RPFRDRKNTSVAPGQRVVKARGGRRVPCCAQAGASDMEVGFSCDGSFRSFLVLQPLQAWATAASGQSAAGASISNGQRRCVWRLWYHTPNGAHTNSRL